MALPADAQSGRLLVVDDNRVNRLLLGRALEQLGHTVTFAENGREALVTLAKRPVDLVLLDIEMPEMDGYQVLAALAADPRLRDLPVVMMSSVEEVDSVARCIEMGAEDYLFKPVNPVLLRARVGASLEKKRLRDRQRELFRQFATAEVAEELLKTGLTLGGKHVEASVMFSDIRAFTSLTEARSPVETIELLNSYYTLMFDAIGGHGGIVNQMLGDGLMAIFGAPLPHADHRDRHRHRRGAAGSRLHGDAAARDLHLRGRDGESRRPPGGAYQGPRPADPDRREHAERAGRRHPRRRARTGPAQDAKPHRRDLLRPRSTVTRPASPREWQNWSGSVACRPAFRAAPTTESEVADLVRAALRASQPVRVAATGHSFVPLCASDGVLLSLSELRGVISADRAAGLATVWAGSTIQQLGPLLREHGVAMANMGDIDRQGIAGAISTGTHGTGRGLGNISTQVVGFRLVSAAGELVDCDAGHEPELFHCARVGLGAFGVLSGSPCACSPPTASTSGSGRSPS